MAQQTNDSELRVDSVRTGPAPKRTALLQRQPSGLMARLRGKISLPGDSVTRGLLGMIVMTLLAAMLGIWFYNSVHLFDGYRIVHSSEEHDVEGTRYAMLGESIIKYGHDGVFCVDTENKPAWSIAYSMQTPVCDICSGTMVIAELQGKQVYVLNESGQLGSFEVPMNIRKARVGSNGVTALLMDDGDVSWISLYDRTGNQIASIRATIEDSGYPIDLAITPNARHMVVSSVSTEGGTLEGVLSFYDFSSSAAERHLMQTLAYANEMFPEVFYASGQTPVAVGSEGFVVFTGGKRPTQKTLVSLEREIVSCFHDGSNIGFVYRSDDGTVKYDMEVYSISGKRAMQASCGFEYTGVGMSDGEILLYDTSHLYVYRASGRQKLAAEYEKEVRYFAPTPGLRKYLIITQDSMDRIRIE